MHIYIYIYDICILIKLLKRREIFVILSKLCAFFNPYISSHTFIVGICLNLYIYIYINIYIYMYIYIYIYIYIIY